MPKNGDAQHDPDAEDIGGQRREDENDVAASPFLSRDGMPNTRFTVGSKRKASALGGTITGQMKKLTKEAERPRMVAHAARDDLTGLINQFVYQVRCRVL